MIRYILFSGLLFSIASAESDPRRSLTIRGQPQDLYFYGAISAKGRPAKVLFLPGDAGWRGFAIDMAKAIAAQGFDVYGWDIKKYLMGFTGKTTLNEREMMADIHEMARLIAQNGPEPVVLAGWSQGAAMAVLAAAAPQRENLYRGVVAIGLPESAALGWRRIDDLTYITRKDPNEPMFAVRPHLPNTAPLPIALIYSTSDEYTTSQKARELYATAREPKRYFEINARNHGFDGNQGTLFRTIDEALRWVSLR